MKKMEVLLVAAAGAAASIPGIIHLQSLKVPGGTEALFEFILAAFSAAGLLALFVLKDHFVGIEAKKVVSWMLGALAGCLALLFLYVYVSGKTFVRYEWGDTWQDEFVPLILPARADSLVEHYGSRSAWLNNSGPDAVIPYVNETNLSVTIIVFLLVYTGLIVTLALAFGIPAVHHIGTNRERPDPETGDEHEEEPPPNGA